MEEVEEQDFGKRYPSLPPNYVSFVQLKERWILQKQEGGAQKEQLASSGNQRQQLKEDNRFDGSLRSSSKNGLGRIHAEGLHVHRNGESRVDAHTKFVPRRQSNPNHWKIMDGTERQWKSSNVQLRDSELAGGSERGNAKDTKRNRWKIRRPMVQKKDSVVHLVPILSRNGVTPGGEEGYTSHENERVREIMSVCMVELAPETKEKEESSVGYSRKPPGKQVVDDHFPDSADSLRVKVISLEKQVVDDQFLSSSDGSILEAKPRGQQPVNGQFYYTNGNRRRDAEYYGKEAVSGQILNNTGAQGSVDEFEVLRKSVSVDEISSVRGREINGRNNKKMRYKRNGNDKMLFGQKNSLAQEVFKDIEGGEELSLGEGRNAGKSKMWSRFKGNEGNSRVNGDSNEIKLKQGHELAGEDISMSKVERTTDPESRTGKGAQACGHKNRDYHWLGKDFGNLSIHGGRQGNSSRGHRWRHGNLGTDLHRNGNQLHGGFVWVKKGEKT